MDTLVDYLPLLTKETTLWLLVCLSVYPSPSEKESTLKGMNLLNSFFIVPFQKGANSILTEPSPFKVYQFTLREMQTSPREINDIKHTCLPSFVSWKKNKTCLIYQALFSLKQEKTPDGIMDGFLNNKESQSSLSCTWNTYWSSSSSLPNMKAIHWRIKVTF